MSGKGSSPRPIPNQQQYEENFDRIFGKKKKPEYVKCEKCGNFWETDTVGNNHDCECTVVDSF